jgi:hypothetical protein
MTTRVAIAVLALLITVPGLCLAQYPLGAAGFHWNGSIGGGAGAFCWGFTCAPSPVTVTTGETVTLTVRGHPSAPYYILFSVSQATQCTSFPGVLNALVLTPPLMAPVIGTLWQASPILSCPQAFDQVTFIWPPGVQLGLTFHLQALTLGDGGLPAFTQAVEVTVQ